GEAEINCLLAERDELVRVNPTLDWMVARRRSQVLRDGHQFAPGGAQVTKCLADLVAVLAEAENEIGLGHQSSRASATNHVERALVAECRPDPLEDPGHGLHVVREHLGLGAEHLSQLIRLAVEVGYEQFDASRGVLSMNLADRFGI